MLASLAVARPEKDRHDRREPRSVSLIPAHWKYLETLAEQLRAERAGDGDPMGKRATVSEAVRHLIGQDLDRRQKDQQGRAVFPVGHGNTRAVDMATGGTRYTVTGAAWTTGGTIVTATGTVKPAGKRKRR